MSGLGNGLVQLFKAGRKRIGNAIDNYLVGGAEARKAIEDEVISRYKPTIERASRAKSGRAANIKDLGDKLAESKKAFQDAQDAWNRKYATELAAAKAQRQTEINDYDAKLLNYQKALDSANRDQQNIWDQLYDSERNYARNKTIFTDVTTGQRFIVDPYSGEYKTLKAYRRSLDKKSRRDFEKNIGNYEERLFDKDTGRLINVFDKNTRSTYKGQYATFDNYLNTREGQNATALRNADNQIKKANDDLTTWQGNNPNRPQTLDENQFRIEYEKNNSIPDEYSFNGQTYKSAQGLNKAYKKALASEQSKLNLDSTRASGFIKSRDAEIAQRIQDAKDMKKAKLALGGALGAGALYAGARAIYGGDDTDNIDNTDYGKPDPDFNVEKEGQAILKDRQQSDPDINVDTDFDPDKADAKAVLADAAHDTGVEDGNSLRASDDLGNNIVASTGGHTMEDRLYELIKAMKDPYKADAIANYIYSRHGDDPEVQNLGWRGWLNKYYGDSLRSIMNRDPSGYKGMHISGGL